MHLLQQFEYSLLSLEAMKGAKEGAEAFQVAGEEAELRHFVQVKVANWEEVYFLDNLVYPL